MVLHPFRLMSIINVAYSGGVGSAAACGTDGADARAEADYEPWNRIEDYGDLMSIWTTSILAA